MAIDHEYPDVITFGNVCLVYVYQGAYRARLQKRLAGMLVILGQLQAEVDEKTLAVKVARERVSAHIADIVVQHFYV